MRNKLLIDVIYNLSRGHIKYIMKYIMKYIIKVT